MFQRQVNSQQAPAVAGDFASANPRANVLTVPGGLVAGLGGVTVGKFAWIDSDGITVRNYATSARAPDGFVHREQQALISTYLAEASNVIPQGFPVVLHNAGDFFATVVGSTPATLNAAVYADYDSGDVVIGSAPTGFSATASMGSTFTATGTGTSLAVSALTGYLSVGDTLGTTAGVPAGTTIVAQVSGTAGGAGTYTTSVATTVAAATVTSFGVALNVTAVGSGTLLPGDAITGTGIPASATIASQVSGATGGVGRYTLNTPATAYAASTTITGTGGIVTGWKAKTAAAVGELTKISTWG